MRGKNKPLETLSCVISIFVSNVFTYLLKTSQSNNFLGMAVAEVAGSRLIFYTHQKNSKISGKRLQLILTRGVNQNEQILENSESTGLLCEHSFA